MPIIGAQVSITKGLVTYTYATGTMGSTSSTPARTAPATVCFAQADLRT